MKIVIGTTNPGKVREIAALCQPFGIDIDTLSLDVEETGSTFAENALIKARAYSEACPGDLVLAEDSGLAVAAMDGLPGPWSARFYDFDLVRRELTHQPGPPPGPLRDFMNYNLLLVAMEGMPPAQRAAAFHIHFVAMLDGTVLFETQAYSRGWIAESPRGTEGFGYDRIFIGENTFGQTYAQLDGRRKNLILHRQEALQNFRLWLGGYEDRNSKS